MSHETKVERASDTELVVTRVVDGPARLVFDAWTRPELIMKWWAPKSFGISFVSCETDVQTGGSYRYVFRHPAADQPMAFFGRYIEAVPPSRLVWTNEEGADGAVTTATFEEANGKTTVTVHDRYPTKEALDAAMADGSTGAWPEQFDALDGLLGEMGEG